MRTVAIIQARMGSTRLAGKVLEDIDGKSMLARVVERARRVPGLAQVLVAITDRPADDRLADACAQLDAPVFRGDEEDVLDRYVGAAQQAQAEAVVRFTSDNPLLDPEVAGLVVDAFGRARPDYATNSGYPLGLHVEVISMQALQTAHAEAREPFERVHVTPFLYRNPERFRLLDVPCDLDCAHYRWTVDTPDDLEFARRVYGHFAPRDLFTWREVRALVDGDDSLAAVNRHVSQKELREG